MTQEIVPVENVATKSAKKWRVLVVEDDQGLNHLAQKVLRRAGFDTDGVLTGNDALERIMSDPDLIALVDQQLPDMKGTEIISTLIKQRHPIPFVAMTGNGNESVAIEMMKLGASDYLIKEFGFIDLLPEIFQRLCSELETKERLDSTMKALHQSEERFKLAMDATQDGLWDWNVEIDEIYLSPNCSSILGYESENILINTKAWNDNVPKVDKPSLFKAFNDCIENRKDDFEVEYRVQSENGDSSWVLERGTVVTRDDNLKVTRMVGTLTDITRLKRDETELATQAATLNTIFNSTPNILILVNKDHQVNKINRSGIVFSTKKEEELIGCLSGEVINCFHSINGQGCGTSPDCSQCPIRTRVDATFETGTPHHEEEGEMPILINNEKTTLNFLISTVLLTVGKSAKVLVTITNITDLKRAELERHSLQNQLHQAQKMQSIGTLAGGIAHDFNNILTAILGYTEMAKHESRQESTFNEDLDQITKAGNRAKELVQQILAFSRQSDTERIPIFPGTVITDAIKMLRPSLPSTIAINQDICDSASRILADPTQLHQIIMNICTNAYHAMEQDGGTLNISLKERSLNNDDLLYENSIEAGAFLQISIHDTGHGIEKGMIDKIFDPYFTTKEPGKGTGMGLSIVHGIVRSYGGFISVESELGIGTTFNVSLPIIDNEPQPVTCTADPILIGNENILFVDDEEVIANMSKKMLEKLGYHVTAESSSLDALETFKNKPNDFDLIITDQTMPNMTGGDLAQTILQIRPDIPIILCTGYSTIITEEKAKALGIKEFVAKPVSKGKLATIIRQVLDT